MKYVAFILAFYFLALALVPCGDAFDCDDRGSTTLISSSDHEQHDGHVENCSPFCICSCCGQYMSTPENVLFELIPHQTYSDQTSFYQTSYFPLISRKIWQPPKLS